MPKPIDTETLDRVLIRINRAAEDANAAAPSGVRKKKKAQPEGLYARYLRQERERTPTAYGQKDRQGQTDEPTQDTQASGNEASRYALFGLGDTPLDAEQGRELTEQGKKLAEQQPFAKLYAARLLQEQARIEAEKQYGEYLQNRSQRSYEARVIREKERIEAEKQYSDYLQERSRAFTERPPINDWEG